MQNDGIEKTIFDWWNNIPYVENSKRNRIL
jgi:hypothetical protein